MIVLTDCFYYCVSWWHRTVSRQIDTCCVVSSHTLTSVLRGAKPAAAKISIRSSCWSRSVWLCWQSLPWSQTFVTHLIILCIIKRYDLSFMSVCVYRVVIRWLIIQDSSWTKDMGCYMCYDGTKDIWKWFGHRLLFRHLTYCKITRVIVR